MSVDMCISCKYDDIITDNHEKYYHVCTCRESEDFLKVIDPVLHSCDYGKLDIEEDEEWEDEE